jgi:catalase (peroxidase I)
MNIRSIARKAFYDFYFQSPMMPQMLRIGMSDALTFSSGKEGTGARGHFNFSRFRKLKENTGLGKHFKTIKEIKEEGNHITERLSISDLIQLAGASAVEYTGGPFIDIKVGRVDLEDEHLASDSTKFPHPDWNITDIRSNYSSIFSDNEIAALFGYRTLGFLCNKDSHKEERWTRNPWVFDNNYFIELSDKNSPYLKTPSDLALLNDDGMRKWVEAFANDENLFFDHFTSAYQKLSELGNKDLLEENTSYLKIEY